MGKDSSQEMRRTQAEKMLKQPKVKEWKDNKAVSK